MDKFEIVCRYEDMSPDGKLELIKQFDGDIIVCITPPSENEPWNLRRLPLAVEFCTHSGGGTSPRTLEALNNLFRAMLEDCNDKLDLQSDRNHRKTIS